MVSLLKNYNKPIPDLRNMARSFKVEALLLAFLVSSQVGMLGGQFGGIDIGSVLGNMDMKTKLMLLVNIIAERPELYNQMEGVILAALPIMGFDKPPGVFMNVVLPWALDHLPDVLKNDEFLKAMEIFIIEINDQNKHNFTRLTPEGVNDTKARRDMFVSQLFSELDYSDMISQLLAYKSARDILPYNSNGRQLSEGCYNSSMAFIDQLLVGEDWALRMFDAAGKPTTGLAKGVMYFLGTYDECVTVQARIPQNTTMGQYHTLQDIHFGGRYCRATINPPHSLVASIAGDHINHTFGLPLTLSMGLCIPDTCTHEDLEGLLNLGFLGTWFNLTLEDAVCNEDLNLKEDSKALIIAGVIGCLLVLVIVSSLIDLFFIRTNLTRGKDRADLYAMDDLSRGATNNAYEDVVEEIKVKKQNSQGKDESVDNEPTGNGVAEGKNKWKGVGLKDLNTTVDSDITEVLQDSTDNDPGFMKNLLRSFSVFLNIEAAVRTDTKQDDIACLYGVRFFTMAWIVLGNTYIYTALSLVEVPVAGNLMDSFDILKRLSFQPVLGATFATDTFIMISGCLICYWFLARAGNEGNMSVTTWLKFYAGKYWKMTPPYILVMMMYVYLYTYLGDGPMWPNSLEVADRCRQDWWKHLLYINNLIGNDGVSAEKQCMTWSWQLAVTMQFYLVSPIIISFLVFSSSMGLLLIVILAAAGIISAGLKESEYGGDILSTREDGGVYWNNVFIKPWCRVSSYCVGMVLGFVLQKLDHKKPHKLFALLGWLLALGVGLVVVYCQYSKFVDGHEPWTRPQMAVFESLGRPAWAACVAWVVYACCMGFGGPLRDLLAWKGFVPLSRLSFMVYLIHPILMVLVVYTRRSLVYIDDFDMAYLFVGHLTINYVAAMFAMLIFDLPFRNLRRIFGRKPLTAPY